MSPALKVAIVGARRSRQGTGPFVAGAFKDAGCEPCAVLGTSEASAAEAARNLRELHGISCRPYASLDHLFEVERPDIVALCCPPEHRLLLLQRCTDAACHVYAEKPLWWEPQTGLGRHSPAVVAATAAELLDRFESNRRLLGINTQWVSTLPDFSRLHPRVLEDDFRLENFRMWLSPAESGERMLVDSISHPLSMLYALAGAGEIEDLRVRADSGAAPARRIAIEFAYRGRSGLAQVGIALETCERQPRPAAYAINGKRIDRHIDPGRYLISFASDNRVVPAQDPLFTHIRQFVHAITHGGRHDRPALVDGMKHFQQIVLALPSNPTPIHE